MISNKNCPCHSVETVWHKSSQAKTQCMLTFVLNSNHGCFWGICTIFLLHLGKILKDLSNMYELFFSCLTLLRGKRKPINKCDTFCFSHSRLIKIDNMVLIIAEGSSIHIMGPLHVFQLSHLQTLTQGAVWPSTTLSKCYSPQQWCYRSWSHDSNGVWLPTLGIHFPKKNESSSCCLSKNARRKFFISSKSKFGKTQAQREGCKKGLLVEILISILSIIWNL